MPSVLLLAMSGYLHMKDICSLLSVDTFCRDVLQIKLLKQKGAWILLTMQKSLENALTLATQNPHFLSRFELDFMRQSNRKENTMKIFFVQGIQRIKVLEEDVNASLKVDANNKKAILRHTLEALAKLERKVKVNHIHISQLLKSHKNQELRKTFELRLIDLKNRIKTGKVDSVFLGVRRELLVLVCVLGRMIDYC